MIWLSLVAFYVGTFAWMWWEVRRALVMEDYEK